MKQIIAQLNAVIREWKVQFSTYFSVVMNFSENSQGILYLNDMAICPCDGLELLVAEFTAERLSFHFEGNKLLTLTIYWPEDGIPYVRSVFFDSDVKI